MNKASIYETTYPRYPFAPLVELGLAIAAWLNGSANKTGTSGTSNQPGSIGGTVGHAA